MTTPAPTGTDDVERDITYEVSYRATFHRTTDVTITWVDDVAQSSTRDAIYAALNRQVGGTHCVLTIDSIKEVR